MFARSIVMIVVGCAAVLGSVASVNAQVGEPQGAFAISVYQGGSLIASDTVTIGLGGQLDDLKASFQDGDPESYKQIGTLPGGTPIILKVTSDGGPDESFRCLHWYIDAPIGTVGDEIYYPGAESLFDPLGGDIEVVVSGLTFANGALTTPLIIGSDTFLTSFMRDHEGHFYESVMANAYDEHGHTIYDIQVPATAYLDGDTGLYNFEVLADGAAASWRWSSIANPGLTTTIHDGTNGGLTPSIPGYVFELGLSVGFSAIPEPATMALLAPVALGLIRSRRRRAR